jgi:hypothetical protein
VWVYERGLWHPGVVGGVSPLAVLVTYQPAESPGALTNTVTADRVATRCGGPPVRPDLAGVLLELGPAGWHAMPRGTRLAIRVESVEASDTDAWVWVRGLRQDPDGGPARWRDRVLVRVEALPPPASPAGAR